MNYVVRVSLWANGRHLPNRWLHYQAATMKRQKSISDFSFTNKQAKQNEQTNQVSTVTSTTNPKCPSPPRTPTTCQALASCSPPASSQAKQSPWEYYRKQYFEVLDLRNNELSYCFDQSNFRVVIYMEKLLVAAASGKQVTLPSSVMSLYAEDFDIAMNAMCTNCWNCWNCFHDPSHYSISWKILPAFKWTWLVLQRNSSSKMSDADWSSGSSRNTNLCQFFFT